MRTIRGYRYVPLALAALIGLSVAAAAQDPAPAAKAKSKATKATKPAPAKGKSAPAPAATAPAPGGGQPALIGQFGDWGAYAATSGGKKVCYALAKPAAQSTVPPNRPRDPAYVFISTRPAENVRNEISVVIGYPFKPGSEAAVDIGSSNYVMYTQADGAWIKNAAEESRMVDAMRKGADMTVVGESGKGTKSTDRYALKGLSQALDRVAQECR